MTVCADSTKTSKTRQALGQMAGLAAGNSFVGEMLIDHDYRITQLERRLRSPAAAAAENDTTPKNYSDEQVAEANRKAAEYIRRCAQKMPIATPEETAASIEKMGPDGFAAAMRSYEQVREELDQESAARQARRRKCEYRIRGEASKRPHYFGVTAHRINGAEKWVIIVEATDILLAMRNAVSLMQAVGLDFGQPRFDAPAGGPAEYEITSVARIAPARCINAPAIVEVWKEFALKCGFKEFQPGDQEAEA